MKVALRQRVVPAFLGTRLALFLLALNVLPYFNHRAVTGDVKLYRQWIDLYFSHGEYPLGDHRWQYPPGAAAPLLLPHWLPGSYYVVFFAMCLAADALVFALLLKAAKRADAEGPSAAGPWLWTLGIAAIGPMAYGRYDLVVTAVAVAALTVTCRSRRATAAVRGVLIGVGAFIKVWPAAILFGAPKRTNGRIMVAAAALAAVVPTLVLQLAFPGVLSFLTNQKSRGIQVESVFATPFLVGKWFGWHGRIEDTVYGAYEYLGPGVSVVAKLSLLATVAGFAVLLLIRLRAARSGGFPWPMLADVAFAAILVAVVTSRVLSPQYLVWLLGVAAVCLTRRDSVMRRPAWTVLGAVSVTQLIFPLFYHSLRGGQVYSGLILVGRNAALVAAAVMALTALWRVSGPRLGQDVLPPLDGEVLRGRAEHRPERVVDRVGGPRGGGADSLVERD